MNIPPSLLVHTVQVRPMLGETSTGKKFGPMFPLRCMAQGRRRRVRDADGDEALSELTLYASPGQADRIPAGSEVTWRGDTTVVMSTTEHDDGGLGAPQHLEVVCE